jgi:hypothetical protein
VLYDVEVDAAGEPASLESLEVAPNPHVSVVIPVLDERESLEPLYSRLVAVLDGLGHSYELIFVDDGSTDGSYEVLRRLHETDRRLRVIRFSSNFGQTAAFSAGFAEARGDIILTLDADLQNDPEDIPSLLDKVQHGYDLVSGWRLKRQDPLLSRRLPSRVANWLIGRVTGVRLHDYGCSLKAYRRDLVKKLSLYGELHRFIPALASLAGARIAEVPVSHHPRIYGRSKYGIRRTFRVIPDVLAVKFLLSGAVSPLRSLGLPALGCVSLGSVLTIYSTMFDMANLALLVPGILLLGMGAQLILMGLVGEWVIRAQRRVRERPSYMIKERLPHRPTARAIASKDESEVPLAGTPRSTSGREPVAALRSLTGESLQ